MKKIDEAEKEVASLKKEKRETDNAVLEALGKKDRLEKELEQMRKSSETMHGMLQSRLCDSPYVCDKAHSLLKS